MRNDYIIVDIETAPIDDAAQYLEPAEAPSHYVKKEAIDAFVEKATAKALDKCGLDPDLCRIVALGWMFTDDRTPTVRTCKTATEEKHALEAFWGDYANGARLVTFNGLKFDLPVLMRRSLYLHVPHPVLNLDRYRTEHVDLWNVLSFKGVIAAHGLKFYLSRFNLASDDTVQGAEIAALVRDGLWADVEAHCRADVQGTFRLAQRMNLLKARELAEVL